MKTTVIAPVASRRHLVVLLLLGAVLHGILLWWFHEETLHVVDEQHYSSLAVNLVTYHEFSHERGSLTSIRPPLYPAFVATVYMVCGLENYQAVRILQSGLHLALVVVVYRLAERMFDRRVGVWAAGITCLYPTLLGTSKLLLTETLFTLLLCLACLAVQQFFERGKATSLLTFGFLLGLAALTRSVALVFALLVPLLLLFAVRGGWLHRLALCAVPLAAFAAAIAPWAIRNTRLQETLTVIDVMGGRNFMMGNYEYTPLHRAWDAISVSGDKAWYRVLAMEHPDFNESTQGQRDKLALRRGLRFMLEHPALTMKRAVVKFFNFWQLERELVAGLTRGYWGGLSKPAVLTLAVLIVGSYAAAMFLGVFGFLVALPADRRMHWVLLLLACVLCGVHTLTFGHSRYHLPLMPLVFIFSANAVVNMRDVWAKRGSWRFWAAVGMCLVLGASWAIEAVLIDFRQL